MLSMPPATITSALPASSKSWASMAAFMPEPHILLTVVHSTPSGRPAPRAAWRAGACPCPAGSTQPMMASSTASADRPERFSAASMAAAPSLGAATSLKSPCRPAIGVRAAPTMTIGSADDIELLPVYLVGPENSRLFLLRLPPLAMGLGRTGLAAERLVERLAVSRLAEGGLVGELLLVALGRPRGRRLVQGLDAHFGLFDLGDGGLEALGHRLEDLELGVAVEDADGADIGFGDLAHAADHRQQPARIGVLLAAGIELEPDARLGLVVPRLEGRRLLRRVGQIEQLFRGG